MPSKKPQMTIRIEEDEYKYLQDWATEEFISVPQLAKIIVKKAISKRRSAPSPTIKQLG
jgi:hypothetical protein